MPAGGEKRGGDVLGGRAVPVAQHQRRQSVVQAVLARRHAHVAGLLGAGAVGEVAAWKNKVETNKYKLHLSDRAASQAYWEHEF